MSDDGLELSRPLPLDRVGADGLEQVVAASDAECAAVAERLGLVAIDALACRWRVRRHGQTFAAEGRLEARIVETCVVTLEPFASTLAEDFAVRFVPAGSESEDEDPDSVDEVPYQGTAIDLGEATVEQLALSLDPYPRGPDADAPEEASAETPGGPFAALARWRVPD